MFKDCCYIIIKWIKIKLTGGTPEATHVAMDGYVVWC